MNVPSARRFARLLAATLLAATATAQAQTGQLEVAIVTDGPSDRRILPVELLQKAAAEAVATNLAVRFPQDLQFEGDWSPAGVDRALDRALADPRADIVLLIGILAAHQGARRPVPPKPVIAATVIDPVLQRFPLSGATSGRANFTYAADFHGIGNDIQAFRQIVGFERLAVLVDAALLDALPEIEQKAAELATSLGVSIDIVRASADPATLLAAIPAAADAVYVTGLLRYGSDDLAILATGLAERGLPSFSLIGRSEVERGLLMTSGGAERDTERLARRVVLAMQRIALGEDPAGFDVSFPTEQRFVINMQVAERIGFSPSWDFLADAERLFDTVAGDRARLTLDDAMQRALAANPTLAASQARFDGSVDDIAISRSNLLPAVDVAIGGTRIDADRASALTQAERTLTAGLTTEQLLYAERAWADYSISRSLSAASAEGLRRDTLDILQSAATAYFDVLRAKSVEAVRRGNVENTRRNLETSRVREAVGLADRSDRLRWVAELARDKQSLLAAESSRRQAEAELARLLHWPAEAAYDTVEAGIDDPIRLVSSPRARSYFGTPARWALFTEFAVARSLDRSPELGQSRALIAGSERAVTAARRAFYLPDLALVASGSSLLDRAGRGSEPFAGLPDDESWSISLQASWPLFTGRRRSAELGKARHELRAAEADHAATADAVETRARTALHRTAASYPAIRLSLDAAAAADENLAMVTDAYGQGAVSVTELIDAQDAALEANLAAADARYGFLIDFAAVLRAMGEFDLLLDPLAREAWYGQIDDWLESRGAATSPPRNRGETP